MSDVITHPLLSLILDQQWADEMTLEEIQSEHNLSGKQVTTLLHEEGLVDLHDQLQLIASHLHTDVMNLEDFDFTEQLLAAIPAETARMYQVLPVGVYDGLIQVVLADPFNPMVVDELAYKLNTQIQVIVADPVTVIKQVEKLYSTEAKFEDLIDTLSQEDRFQEGTGGQDDAEPQIIEEVGDATPIVRFVNLVLYQALKEKAADVHFEPFEDDYRIRMKVDGSMKQLTPPPRELSRAIASRIKVMANLNIAENRIPQDGKINTVIGGQNIDMRCSTLPTQFGESVVLRLLDRTSSLLDLNALAMPEKITKHILHCVEQPNGIFLVTGPTGSGKTTTLYACLRRLNQVGVKILTAEDPVEYPIDGIVQVQISEAQGMTFAKALKSFLRQDPDIILVGEMRDLETASTGIEASLTGHLVVSTLHTNSATEAITRLLDMGVEPFLIATSVNGVLAQRLVKTICPKCRSEFGQLTHDQIEMLGITKEDAEGKVTFLGHGCDNCNNSGYKGRRGIYESLPMNPVLREMISQRAPGIQLQDRAREQGMLTLREDGLDNMFRGVTTFEEVMKST